MARLLPLVALLAACGGASPAPRARDVALTPPIAAVRPHPVESPHGTRIDPYYWLRDDTRRRKDVLDHLRAENAYAEAALLAPTAELQKTLYAEMVGRIREDDTTVPELQDGYWYYARTETGKQYPIHVRRKGTMDAAEEVVLDANQLAAGHDFYAIGGWDVSPDGTKLAWAEDVVGRNQFTLRVEDLTTGEVLADTARNISGDLAWANDSRTLFYVGKDETTLRESKVYRHVLGGGDDVLVHDETDGAFYTSVGNTKSKRFVTITLWSTVATEVRLIDADRPTSAPVVFLPRERDHEYDVEHLGGRFVVRTNWQAKNFRLVEVAQADHADRAAWRDLVPHRDDVLIEDYAVYDRFVAVGERSGGLARVRVVPAEGAPFPIDADEPAFAMYLDDTWPPDSTRVRYVYVSMTTPRSTYELDVTTGERTLLKREPVEGGYHPADYATEYLHATARDGAAVPISLVYKKTTPRDGSAPLLVYGYGAYGASMEPTFDAARLSLLDRGWVYAVAHVRGGEERGRRWYEDGKLLRKKNTFFDFIDCTEHLVKEGYGGADRVFAAGGSAGGLLMGAIVNLRPDLYRGVLAAVPFVDVVTTMLDESIPLTSNELDEWGDPTEKPFYDYMLSYSPYDNVAAQDYPSMLVTTGLWDSQVQYFEPAKWVARLRATKTDDNLLVLHTDMAAGHGGKAGRYDSLTETSRDYAFLLHVLERPDARSPRRGVGVQRW
jgi:oligopeptidase B